MQSSRSLRASPSVRSAFQAFRSRGSARCAPMPDACERRGGVAGSEYAKEGGTRQDALAAIQGQVFSGTVLGGYATHQEILLVGDTEHGGRPEVALPIAEAANHNAVHAGEGPCVRDHASAGQHEDWARGKTAASGGKADVLCLTCSREDPSWSGAGTSCG